jgi:RNA polymerase sigma-70 factor (ECF subfamily)
MAEGRPRFEPDRKAHEELADRFFDAFTLGDVDALQSLLAADVVLQGDGGGKGPQYGRGFVGARNVARAFVSTIPPFLRIGGVVEQRTVNGQPGAVFHDPDGGVVGVMVLEIVDGRIRAIRGVSNPDKLAHLGPLGDPWALRRAVGQARRHPGA